MIEDTHVYLIEDEDGDTTKVTFTLRHCMCGSPGCVDDEIAVELAEDDIFRIQIPRLMRQYLEGVFNGEYKVK